LLLYTRLCHHRQLLLNISLSLSLSLSLSHCVQVCASVCTRQRGRESERAREIVCVHTHTHVCVGICACTKGAAHMAGAWARRTWQGRCEGGWPPTPALPLTFTAISPAPAAAEQATPVFT
jgi:hypothetical protein